ncbi:MAG TPA: metallophosphoesterase family protein [Vicinamibacterales bacterium]|nr:metallophosphoesterase family protein [Vicinamibacterales bacterium]
MRYLIVSDLHANLEAFEAVLAVAPPPTWDRFIVLGDLVGYGAAPNAVIDRVRSLRPFAIIRGNHDKAACGIEDASNFNHIARVAAAWTGETLTPENRDYLRGLPAGPVTIDDRVEICHGSPFDEDHYIFDADDAWRAIETGERQLCLFGHTHLPVVFQRTGDHFEGFVPEGDEDVTLRLESGVRYVVNPGSVGQPRDGDPRAAFALYDSDTLTLQLRRVAYPVDAAQRRIIGAGLPASLANRLAVGR